MSHRRLNILSDLYFVLILTIGIVYFAFLSFSFAKIFPGFTMQLIFLLDSLKFGQNIFSTITTQDFIVNVIPGILLFNLFIQLFKSIIILFGNIFRTQQLISSLPITKSTQHYSIFKSSQNSVFTLGFFKPQIFVSSSLFQTYTKSEINSIIHHEINHQNNLHPLKIFVSNFIKSFTPTIPGKVWLFDSYLTSTEISSDTYSENKVKSKKSLVSALIKFQLQNFEVLPASISYFNSQTERIKVLVGQQKPHQQIPMIYSSLIILTILYSAITVKNTNLFYECQHLAKCVQTLVTSPTQSLSLPSSDHCK